MFKQYIKILSQVVDQCRLNNHFLQHQDISAGGPQLQEIIEAIHNLAPEEQSLFQNIASMIDGDTRYLDFAEHQEAFRNKVKIELFSEAALHVIIKIHCWNKEREASLGEGLYNIFEPCIELGKMVGQGVLVSAFIVAAIFNPELIESNNLG